MFIDKIKYWLLAARLKTLPASVAPVLIGFSYAIRSDYFQLFLGIEIIICAILIQVLTNFVNDVSDFERGADVERVGPMRVVSQELISPKEMKYASLVIALIALLIGLHLVSIGGVLILIIGILSLFFAVLYTAGPWPLAYLGLGEIFVLIFFGPVAVCGTVYLFNQEVYVEAVLSGLSAGFLSCGILVLNNLRDIESDRKANKKTLAVRFGARFAKIEYMLCIFSAFILHIYNIYSNQQPIKLAFASLALLPCLLISLSLFRKQSPGDLISALVKTSSSLLAFSAFFLLLS